MDRLPVRAWWILAAALAVRLVAALARGSFDLAREAEMGLLARNILAGKGFSAPYFAPERPTAAFPPFEGYFYALIHAVCGQTTWSLVLIVVLRCLLSVATAYVVYRIASRVYGPRIAMLALVVTAFHPAFIYYSAVSWVLVRPPYSMFVVSLLILALVRLAEDVRPRRAVVAGALFGVTALVQPDILAFLPVALGWLGWVVSRRVPWQRASLATVACVPVVCLLVISPWTLRNYLVMGEFILLRSDHGTHFWIGNNPVATGDYLQVHGLWKPRTSLDIEPAATLSPEVLERVQRAPEAERDRILLRQALAFIAHRPDKFLELTAKRLRNFWIGPPKPRAGAVQRLAGRAFGVYSLALLGGAVAGAWITRRSPASVLLVLLVATYTAIHGLAHAAYYYYRMTMEPSAILLALVAAVAIADRWREPTRRTSATSGTARA